MLRSDFCHYSDAYIVVKIWQLAMTFNIWLLAAAANENDKAQKNITFKNNPLFRSCISKINSTLIDNAEDLNIVNYSMTSGSRWNYYRDEVDNVNNNALQSK